MPYKTSEARRRWNRERRRKRRQEWLDKNGPCQHCGSNEDLQVDHIDPKSKEVEVARIWTVGRERLEKELAKCQVLCSSCHKKKTREDMGWKTGHGTRTFYMYRKCRCDQCKEWHRLAMQDYNHGLKMRVSVK